MFLFYVFNELTAATEYIFNFDDSYGHIDLKFPYEYWGRRNGRTEKRNHQMDLT